jgi:DivIVA domain-containing protein
VIVFFLLVVVLLVGLTAALVTGKLGGVMAEPTSTSGFEGLPEGPVATEAIAGLRFDQAFRGYRMDQVDAVLDRLAAELRARDEELAALRGQGHVEGR